MAPSTIFYQGRASLVKLNVPKKQNISAGNGATLFQEIIRGYGPFSTGLRLLIYMGFQP